MVLFSPDDEKERLRKGVVDPVTVARVKAADDVDMEAPEVQREAVRRVQAPSLEDMQSQRISDRADSLSSPPSLETEAKADRNAGSAIDEMERSELDRQSRLAMGQGVMGALGSFGAMIAAAGGVQNPHSLYEYDPAQSEAARNGVLQRFSAMRGQQVAGKRHDAEQQADAEQRAADLAARQERARNEMAIRQAGEDRLRTAAEARTAREEAASVRDAEESAREAASATAASPESLSAANIIIEAAARRGEPLPEAQQATVRGSSRDTLSGLQRFLDSPGGRRRRGGGGGHRGGGGNPGAPPLPATEAELPAPNLITQDYLDRGYPRATAFVLSGQMSPPRGVDTVSMRQAGAATARVGTVEQQQSVTSWRPIAGRRASAAQVTAANTYGRLSSGVRASLRRMSEIAEHLTLSDQARAQLGIRTDAEVAEIAQLAFQVRQGYLGLGPYGAPQEAEIRLIDTVLPQVEGDPRNVVNFRPMLQTALRARGTIDRNNMQGFGYEPLRLRIVDANGRTRREGVFRTREEAQNSLREGETLQEF